jgi:hypothetical protein
LLPVVDSKHRTPARRSMVDHEKVLADEPSASVAAPAKPPSLCEPHRADHIAHDWLRIGFGIALAGGAYPVVLAAFGVVLGYFAIVLGVLAGNPIAPMVGTAITGVLLLGIYAIGGALIGMAWTGLVAAMTLPIVCLITWSLQLKESMVMLGALSGGLVGFLAVLPFTSNVPWLFAADTIWQTVGVLAMGPALTTILGQIGGAWGGSQSRGLWIDWKTTLADAGGWNETADSPANGQSATCDRPIRLQFGIRHLLWMAVWLSLLLSLIRLSGFTYDVALPALSIWLVYQAITLIMGFYLARRIGPWWLARRRQRST